MRLFYLSCTVVLLFFVSLSSSARGQQPVLSSLVKADACDNQRECKFTYTLATLIGRAIVQAESIIGPRDKNYVLLGYEFSDNPAPQIWFPGDRKHVVIQLTRQAMLDKKRALFQMGHEVFHTISPIVGKANALEEGLATELSINFVQGLNIEIDPNYIDSKNYRMAYDAISCLRYFEPKLNSHLQKMRVDGYQVGAADFAILSKYLKHTPAKIRHILEKKLADFNKQDSEEIESCLNNLNSG